MTFPLRLSAVTLVLTLGTSGCFYHSTLIELAASTNAATESGEAGRLSDAEVDRASEIVAVVVSEHGLTPSTSDVEHLSRTEDEWSQFVLAAYWTGEDAATDNRVVVSVKRDKQTGRFSILIRDLDSASTSDFTDSLERALTTALSEAFPSRTFRVDRKTVGPALGP